MKPLGFYDEFPVARATAGRVGKLTGRFARTIYLLARSFNKVQRGAPDPHLDAGLRLPPDEDEDTTGERLRRLRRT
jgi:hypothetical protein